MFAALNVGNRRNFDSSCSPQRALLPLLRVGHCQERFQIVEARENLGGACHDPAADLFHRHFRDQINGHALSIGGRESGLSAPARAAASSHRHTT